jgi:hypothetical protein
MVKKVLIAPGVISKDKLNTFMKNGKITMSSTGDEDIELDFKTLKAYNKYVRNLSNGKGAVISTNDLNDVRDREGGSIFGSFKKVAGKVAKRNIGSWIFFEKIYNQRSNIGC